MNPLLSRSILIAALSLWVLLPTGRAGTLVGTFTPVPIGTDVNLSTNGPLDWVHWGTFTEYASDRKAIVTPLISEFTLFGNNPNPADGPFQFSDNTNGYSWYDGAQNTRVLYTTTGVYEFGKNTGFQFTVPADTTQRVVRVYVGTFASKGQFTATLSDNSAPGYSNSSLDNNANGPGAVYTIRYAANSANRLLTIRWIASQLHNNQAGNVTLQAATLSFPSNNNPPMVWINTPTNGQNFFSSSNVTIDATALDTDGSITNVEFFEGATKLGNIPTAPFTFTWTNIPLGNLSLTARAFDNSGAVRVSKGVEIWGYTNGGNLTASFASTASNIVLSVTNTRDWAHWGHVTSNSFDHRAITPPQLNNFSTIGTNVVRRLTDDRTKWSWTGGTPTTSATDSTTAVYIFGFTNGYDFTLPAGTNSRTAHIYVGLSAARGKFQASLSDLSAPSFTDESLVNVYKSAYREYVLSYAAASEGQSLRIRYTSAASYDSVFGNVTWHSASLNTVAPLISLSAPTNNTHFVEPATIPLAAQPFDADGNISSVQFLQDSNLIGLRTNAPYSLFWSNVPMGSYSLRTRVTDDDGLVGTSTPVTVIIDSNIPPSVTLTAPLDGQTFIGPTNLTLSADVSDPDTPISIVEFFSGNLKIGQRTSPPYSITWSNVIKGFYALSARATDDHGKSNSSAPANIVVSNGPPLVTLLQPTNNARYFEGMNVPLAAGAIDLDGVITQVHFLEGTNALANVTNFPFLAVWSNVALGTYTLAAQAIDDDGAVTLSPSALVTVVTNAPPSVAIISPTNGQGIVTPNVTLVANAADSDGFISRIEFFAGTNLLGQVTNAPYTFVWTNAPRGAFELSAVARDDWTGVTTSAPIAIVVSNRAPLVTLASPLEGARFFEGTNITISATAVDVDDAISLVEFFASTNKIGAFTNPPFVLTWSNVARGDYALTVRAIDLDGAVATTPPISISVVTNAPPAVAIVAPFYGQNFLTPVDISISADATDGDGVISLVEFFAGASKLGEATHSPFTFLWTNAPRGSFILTATAHDNWTGVTTSSPIAISVSNRPPSITLISPTNGAQYVFPATIQLDASASDLDGNISRVVFFAGTNSVIELTNAPFAYTWTNVAEGAYQITAQAIDNDGAKTSSAATGIVVVTNIPPSISLTSPTNGSTFIEGDIILLAANVSDSDGNVQSVEFFIGTNHLVSLTNAPFSFSWSNAVAGEYSLTAVAKDDYGDTNHSATIGIMVVTNTFPSIAIGVPANGSGFFAPVNIPISATATDSDGTIRHLAITANGIPLGATTNSSLSLVWSNSPKGAHILSAMAVDDRGATNFSPAVNVFVSNTPPTITLTTPTNGMVFVEGDAISVVAATGDVDGTAVMVEFFDNTNRLVAITNLPFSFVWTNASLGNHSLIGLVTDNDGATNYSTLIALSVVTNQYPQVTISSPTNNTAFFAPAPISVTVSAFDADGVVTQMELYGDSNLLAQNSGNTLAFVWTNASKGAHTLIAIATDNRGATNASSPASFFVSNTPPSISLDTPTNGSVFVHGDPILIRASPSDVDGSVTLVEFFAATNKLTALTNGPFEFAWTNAALGSHSLSVAATDDNGSTSTSAVIIVSVVTNQFPLVAITSPTNAEIFLSPASVPISTDVSDPDGIVTLVEFFANTNKIGELTNPPWALTASNLTTGTYSLTAAATDNRGAKSVSLPLFVTVNRTPPLITLLDPTIASSAFVFSFATIPEWNYQVWSADSVDASNWTVITNFTGDGNAAQVNDEVSTNIQKYYRVIAQ